jgi:hypothetical protein
VRRDWRFYCRKSASALEVAEHILAQAVAGERELERLKCSAFEKLIGNSERFPTPPELHKAEEMVCPQHARCPHFGLILGSRYDHRILGLPGAWMQNAPDLESALSTRAPLISHNRDTIYTCDIMVFVNER